MFFHVNSCINLMNNEQQKDIFICNRFFIGAFVFFSYSIMISIGQILKPSLVY